MIRKSLGFAALSLLTFVAIGFAPAHAASWPEKPIRIIIPWAPGGSTDIVGRLLAADLTKRLKQQVIIDNRPGAGAIVGMEIASQSPPEGYTFMVTSTGYGYLISKAKVDLIKSFAPVALLGFGDSALVVTPTLPVKSVKELVALAKARPGQINYSSSGVGGFPHMNTELFKMMTGTNMVHIPFKGGGPAIADTAAGHTQVHLGSLATVMPQVRAGRVRMLALGSAKRNPILPDVPTISESGVPGYESYIWFGMFAPRGTSADIISQMHAATNVALKVPDMVQKLDAAGVRAETSSTAEFGKLMVSEAEKWARVIKAAGIKEE